MQVRAVSCNQDLASIPTFRLFNIQPVGIELSMTLGGEITSFSISTSKQLQQLLISGVSNALGVPVITVMLASRRDSRRQLLVSAVTFKNFASSASEVYILQHRAETADFQESFQQKGLVLTVSTVSANTFGVNSASNDGVNSASNEPDGLPKTTLAGIIAGSAVGGLLLIVGIALGTWYGFKKQSKARKELQQGMHAPQQSSQLAISAGDQPNTVEWAQFVFAVVPQDSEPVQGFVGHSRLDTDNPESPRNHIHSNDRPVSPIPAEKLEVI
jgi:hypothetical protein